MASIRSLPPEKLYHRFDPEQFPFETTAELEDMTEVVGQRRAVDSIRFGINISQHGYNLYALGPKGQGKQRAVWRYLQQAAAEREAPPDWCYVHNFDPPHQPRALRLPAGMGTRLATEMTRLLEELQAGIPAAFESEDYHGQRQAIEEELKKQQEQAFEDLQREAKEKNIALIQTPGGLAFAPLAEGEVISPQEFLKLPSERQQEVQGEVEGLQNKLQRILRHFPQWRKENRTQLKALNESVAEFAIGPYFKELRSIFAEAPAVLEYLAALARYTVEHVERFLKEPEQEQPLATALGISQPASRETDFTEYKVNVLVDHGGSSGAPVIHCDLPTYQNLVGRVEHVSHMGALLTNFTLIKPGALHKANGGYLLLDALKLLQQPSAWDGLKRALQAGEIVIESLGQVYSIISTISLEPEAIPLSVKVVLLGDRRLYYLLHQHDPEFGELFKVMVDFDDDTIRTADNALLYGRIVGTQVREEALRHFNREAVAALIEHATRLAGDQDKLSTHMQSLSDIVRESSYWAGTRGREIVEVVDVIEAIAAQKDRAGRLNEVVRESILKDMIFIDTSGERVGQINGLSVYLLGTGAFGKPSRITARIRMGKGDVVDIDRQVEMSGPIHGKGVLIVSSFLASRYAVERPLSLSASIVFEQSYGGVEGDSASSTELYALLSALAEAPIRQGLAVTGSVNQFGEVQAIGGVNEKIEGYFEICRSRGLTSKQGVLIPSANVRHLCLSRDVVDAVAAGEFHIYPVAHIDEGIELLTGIAAGEPDAEGVYPEDSINGRVVARLEEISRKQRQYTKGLSADAVDDEGQDDMVIGGIHHE